MRLIPNHTHSKGVAEYALSGSQCSSDSLEMQDRV